MTMPHRQDFLPTTGQDLQERGWGRPDFILVTGDAYVDHPSFGAALISRLLEADGYRVAILAQPDSMDPESFRIFGRPRLAFLVTAGNLDSMVANYTVNCKFRKNDAYSPGGRGGARPDRACLVYTNLIRRAYKKVPVILGGLEASLRRLTHYDYWSDRLRRSILDSSKQDMVRLVRTIAEKVIHVEVRSREKPILRAVEKAIHAAVQSEEYRVRVNPEDMSVVTENKPLFLASISGLQNIVIESDEEISRGGCVVESDQGKVDGTIETQLEKIQEQLDAEIASEDA